MNMARLKLPGFALLCVALGFWGLSYLSGRTAELASKQTAERLAWGQLLFQTSGRLAQAYRVAALASAASDPPLVQALAAAKEHEISPAASAAAQKAVSAAFEKLPRALGSPAHILIATPRRVTALDAGSGEVQMLDPAAYNLAGAAQVNAAALHALVDGRLYRVAAAVVRGPDGSPLGYLGVAAPLDDAFAAEQAKDLTMDVTVLGGQAITSSLSTAEREKVAAAPDGPVELEKRRSLGFPLPVFVGGAPLQVDKSFPLDGAAGARIVLTATALPLQDLAGFQQKAFLFLAGIALVGLALSLLPAPASAAEAREALSDPAKAPRETPAPAPAPAAVPLAIGAEATEPALAPLPLPDSPAALGNPDDFPFGASATPAAEDDRASPAEPPPARAPDFEAELLAGLAPTDFSRELPPPPTEPQVVPEPLASSGVGASFFGPEPSVPLPSPASEPAEAAAPPSLSALSALLEAAPLPGDRPFDLFGPVPASEAEEAADAIEKTAVSTVPEDLLRATRWPTPNNPLEPSDDAAVPLPAPPSAAALNPDEAHFQEVYLHFLAVRAQCNQTADGLTFEKFAAKLRKNKEQLVQKYSCRTVRFQAYVKDGKAALKASPVKD